MIIANVIAQTYTTVFNGSTNWPNITLPGFERIFINQNSMMDSRGVSFNPIIKNPIMRSQWEAYANEYSHLLEVPNTNIYTGAQNTWIISNGIYSRNGTQRIKDPGMI